jgi:hypothetical protein
LYFFETALQKKNCAVSIAFARQSLSGQQQAVIFSPFAVNQKAQLKNAK